jgi:hypothetical protein
MPCFTPRKRAPNNHWIRGWVSFRTALDDMEMGKFLILLGQELWPIVQLVASHYTDCSILDHRLIGNNDTNSGVLLLSLQILLPETWQMCPKWVVKTKISAGWFHIHTCWKDHHQTKTIGRPFLNNNTNNNFKFNFNMLTYDFLFLCRHYMSSVG